MFSQTSLVELFYVTVREANGGFWSLCELHKSMTSRKSAQGQKIKLHDLLQLPDQV